MSHKSRKIHAHIKSKDSEIQNKKDEVLLKIIAFVQQHEAVFAIVSAALVTIVIGIMKFIKYLFELGKTTCWKIDQSVISLNEDSLYGVFITILLALLSLAAMMIPYLIHRAKFRLFTKIILQILAFIIFSIVIIVWTQVWQLVDLQNWITVLALLVAILITYGLFIIPSTIFAIMIWYDEKTAAQAKKINSKMGVVILVASIAALLWSLYSLGADAATPAEYRITDDGYAIVYETDDAYYMAECEAKNGIYTIKRNRQKYVLKTDVEYEFISADHIKIEY